MPMYRRSAEQQSCKEKKAEAPYRNRGTVLFLKMSSAAPTMSTWNRVETKTRMGIVKTGNRNAVVPQFRCKCFPMTLINPSV